MENLKVFYNKVKTISTKFGAAMIVKSTPKFRGGKTCPFVGRVEKNDVNNKLPFRKLRK